MVTGFFMLLTVGVISIGIYASTYMYQFHFELAEKGVSSFSAGTYKTNSNQYAQVDVENNGITHVSDTAFMYVAVFDHPSAGYAITNSFQVTGAPVKFRLDYETMPGRNELVYLGGLRNYYGSALYGTWEP